MSPYKWLTGMLALVSSAASSATDHDSTLPLGFSPAELNDDPSISKVIVKRFSGSRDGSWKLAAHRSHSSHSSHSSHRSHSSHYSGTGGGTYTPPVYSPPPSPPPAKKIDPPPQRVVPAVPAPPAAASESAKLAMRIQLALNSLGYCSCKVDGQYGGETERALKKFQKDNGLRETGVPDLDTLKKLGISF